MKKIIASNNIPESFYSHKKKHGIIQCILQKRIVIEVRKRLILSLTIINHQRKIVSIIPIIIFHQIYVLKAVIMQRLKPLINLSRLLKFICKQIDL